jgi:hypothetical protein
MTILDALEDRGAVRRACAVPRPRHVAAWLVFLRALYGLPLDDEGVETFRAHTGRTTYDPPAGGWREVVCITGRQSGKTRISATHRGV